VRTLIHKAVEGSTLENRLTTLPAIEGHELMYWLILVGVGETRPTSKKIRYMSTRREIPYHTSSVSL